MIKQTTFDKVMSKIGLSFVVRIKDYIKTRVNMIRFSKNENRKLEIGPGEQPLPGFETLNKYDAKDVDYILDVTKPLPFADKTFDLIYASHVLEHVPWYQINFVMAELYRVLKEGGTLEIFVPDGLKICQSLVRYELCGESEMHKDGWYKFNDEKDPYIWVNGRIFTYGNGSGSIDHPNWHRTLFTPRYLKQLLERAGFINVEFLKNKDVRGYDHGWINLGIRGRKNKN